MAKRLFDIAAATVALIVLAPVFLIVTFLIRRSSPGPIFYRARRIGINQTPFTMYKFRTMHVEQPASASVITAKHDPRVFPLGSWLRRLKIDELPQLINILRGEMSIVGPRPEDPKMVQNHYVPDYREIFGVLPGLTSPGSLYDYTHGYQLLDTDDPESYYVNHLLPVMLALELVYVRNASFLYDLRLIFRTIWTILLIALGKRDFREPPEMQQVRRREDIKPRATRRGSALAVQSRDTTP